MQHNATLKTPQNHPPTLNASATAPDKLTEALHGKMDA